MQKNCREVEVVPQPTQYLKALTRKIKEKLSSSKLKSYVQLMEDFRVQRIGRPEIVRSVLSLFEHEEDLLRMFCEVVPDEFLPSGTDDEEEEEEEEDELEEEETREGLDNYYHNDDRNYDHDDNHDNDHGEDHTDDDEEELDIREEADHDHNNDHNCNDEQTNELDDYDDDDDIELIRVETGFEGIQAVDENPEEDLSAEDMMKIRQAQYFHNEISRISEEEESEGIYKEFLDTLNLYRHKQINLRELKELILSLFSDHGNLIDEFYRILLYSDLITPEDAVLFGKPGENNKSKSKSFKYLDLLSCERVTPSYRVIPEEYRSSVQNLVLNNQCVSVGETTNSEYVPKKRSVYEEKMLEREEDIFEADMLESFLYNAVKTADEILTGKKKIEDIGVMFYRCVARVFGEHGLEMVRELRREPMRALPVILRRLEQKLRELNNTRTVWEVVWKDVFEESSMKVKDGADAVAAKENS